MLIQLAPIHEAIPGAPEDPAEVTVDQHAAYGLWVNDIVRRALAGDPAVLLVHAGGSRELATLYKGEPLFIPVPS